MEDSLSHWLSILLLITAVQTAQAQVSYCNSSNVDSIYNYGATTIKGRYYSFREFMGKMLLIVNVASYWGLTNQYLDLNALNMELEPYNFTILAFPSNQFGKQEPGTNKEILLSLKYVRPGNGFEPNFPMFRRGDVNGVTEQRHYTYLKNVCPPVGDSFGNPYGKLFWAPMKISDVKWNFEKFLVSPAGQVLQRWGSHVPMVTVRAHIIRHMRFL